MELINLKWRMYGCVPYNLSEIQKGIQFGHAVVDYGQTVSGVEPYSSIYSKWANNDKTFIIVNGGTTNTNPERFGTLNKHLATLNEIGIKVQDFYEPDLGDQLTAICFLVDERVYDKETYPDVKIVIDWKLDLMSTTEGIHKLINMDDQYKKWVNSIGGEKNAILRNYLSKLRLA